MCAETVHRMPLLPKDPKPKVTKPANALEPGQSPAPGQTKPDVGKGAPPEPPTRPGFRAYRNRILAQQATGKKSQTAVKQFPGSRKLLQTGSGSGSGSGGYPDMFDDSSWMYEELPTDDDMADMYADMADMSRDEKMRNTYCLKVLKQGVQWKMGVVPIDLADSKPLDDFDMELEIPGTSC